jgi:hypothetical protein
MPPDFIFMLTHTDRTIPDAQDRVPEALGAGVRHFGVKDIGLPFAAYGAPSLLSNADEVIEWVCLACEKRQRNSQKRPFNKRFTLAR